MCSSDLRAEASGLAITRGGRFHHLMGSGQDKGLAVRKALEVFCRCSGQRFTAIGLGDSANDKAMLESVDLAVLLPHPDGTYEELGLTGLRKARHPGSRGWNEMVLELLDALEEDGP